MSDELRKELGNWWPLWMVLYGFVCGASGGLTILYIVMCAAQEMAK